MSEYLSEILLNSLFNEKANMKVELILGAFEEQRHIHFSREDMKK